ncbi:unnamed protein product [Cylindrotheca closterium]|uniref:Isopenicillin N synthase-like Fe(2+) 2OG dioxygenase domain-containing protein n=1 Tax=Cylindrotheca closterium TaxID=2856 RepID=A0AAD2PXJ5_9STRA|nr:unnamed protein product [Cylindrotheca closterium]
MRSSLLLPACNLLLVFACLQGKSSAFQSGFRLSSPRYLEFNRQLSNKNYDDGEVGTGDNWIERSFPVDTEEGISTKKVEDYNLGISGEAFQTGSLSKKMFDAICSRTSLDMSDEIREAFVLYAMDFTAKEAARAALSQNGLEMVLQEEEEDQGMWGDVEAIRLYNVETGSAIAKMYDSLEDAVKDWTPGQTFDFVARQVPAKIRELSLDELVDALDPEGKIRAETGEKSAPDEEALLSIFDETDISSLSDLAADNIRRTENTPRIATREDEAFAGLSSKGYNVIKRSDLSLTARNADGSENEKTLLHVMDALVSHGVLIVDMSDGGSKFDDTKVLADMWQVTGDFFEKVQDDAVAAELLPGMEVVAETGSQHARVGYSSFDNGSLKFLETRRERNSGDILPKELTDVVGADGVQSFSSAFDVITSACKDVVRIAVATCSVEYGAFQKGKNQGARASEAANLLVQEVIDDGKPMRSTDIEHSEGTVSMSPHRLGQYSESSEAETAAREVFGAHVDASFITAVPVAAISGLEVYDEDSEKWYRPELKARETWEAEKKEKGGDSSAVVEELKCGATVPWHSRYLVVMAGEQLQVATRNEIPATVHRVVAAKDGPSRLSAPILLRPRPGTKFHVDRYLGGTMGNALLLECDGKTMEEIYDATQPQSYQ